ncbi:Lumazine-binding domain [Mycobacteroides abscessus subsp. massiliense]|uniref:Rv0361 family membrane protein n=1 Tax=Mycobacteroides abscessus TaxID=36809 RepID=UPI0009D0AF34|nr:hypothetical protein [Mycobacteroides abscessus]SKT85264.1 Lumazine-binding domain [Mycobacteroides abscessus subsp. massiliense]
MAIKKRKLWAVAVIASATICGGTAACTQNATRASNASASTETPVPTPVDSNGEIETSLKQFLAAFDSGDYDNALMLACTSQRSQLESLGKERFVAQSKQAMNERGRGAVIDFVLIDKNSETALVAAETKYEKSPRNNGADTVSRSVQMKKEEGRWKFCSYSDLA